MEIDYYRKMKGVERLSIHHKQRSYNLLEHSYMVSILFKKFASLEDISYTMVEFDLILHHDIPEVVTGDLPYSCKNFNEVTKHSWGTIERENLKSHHQLLRYEDVEIKNSLTESQYNLFKVCDLLDLWIFIKEEQGLGNASSELDKVRGTCEELICGKYRSVDNYMKSYIF